MHLTGYSVRTGRAVKPDKKFVVSPVLLQIFVEQLNSDGSVSVVDTNKKDFQSVSKTCDEKSGMYCLQQIGFAVPRHINLKVGVEWSYGDKVLDSAGSFSPRSFRVEDKLELKLWGRMLDVFAISEEHVCVESSDLCWKTMYYYSRREGVVAFTSARSSLGGGVDSAIATELPGFGAEDEKKLAK